MPASLRDRLGYALALTAGASVLLAALLSFGLVRGYAEDQARRNLRELAITLAADPIERSQRLAPPARQVARLLQVNGDQLALVLDGGVVAAVGTFGPERLDVAPVLGGSEVSGTADGPGGPYVYVGLPVVGQRGVRGVVVARPVRLTRDLWVSLTSRILLAGALAVLAALGLSALLARRLVEPLRGLSRAASRIAGGDLSQRVPEEGDDEVAELARSFNEMSTALGEAQRREREFLASVSHELRTPLTSIRGYAEALEDNTARTPASRANALRVIRSETERLERMVQDVMDLARLGAREFHLDVRPCDLAPVLRETLEAHRSAAEAKELSLAADVRGPLELETDPDRVRQVVSNLLENAIRVTPGGGRIDLRASAREDTVRVEVADTGPGIAAEDLPHAFERSYLWRAARGERPVGTGLGLAIVRELSTALGGRVSVASDAGAGSVFRVELPLRARVDA